MAKIVRIFWGSKRAHIVSETLGSAGAYHALCSQRHWTRQPEEIELAKVQELVCKDCLRRVLASATYTAVTPVVEDACELLKEAWEDANGNIPDCIRTALASALASARHARNIMQAYDAGAATYKGVQLREAPRRRARSSPSPGFASPRPED